VRVRDRDAIEASMQARGVDVRFHYPTPVHLQPAYADLGHRPGDLPVAEAFAAQCLSLPMFPGITPAQQEVVVDALRAAVEAAA
jgi:dTDP-4-amino-4,6-dideoxygalactose transaminase